MKKTILLLVAVFALVSCTEEIRRNDPALQGLKDGVDWRAGGAYATMGLNGDITIYGGNQFENLELHLPTTDPGTYALGNSNSRTASFEYTQGGLEKVFSTGLNRGDGQIIVQEFNIANRTITGTFRFNAVDEDAADPANPANSEILNFQSGVFYRVPITGVTE